MMTKRMWLNNEDCIVLPAEVRKEAGIGPDDEIFITVGEGIVILSTRPSVETHLAEFRRIMDEAGISLEDMLKESDRIREEVYRERYGDG
jgi:bifunctional DNA-binding transcriptional regulator/antitoxin component of YhaV-PrlF toxin-antitoxin module